MRRTKQHNKVEEDAREGKGVMGWKRWTTTRTEGWMGCYKRREKVEWSEREGKKGVVAIVVVTLEAEETKLDWMTLHGGV
mmetsp:Transcript_36996/g.55100  ORF Transcript_36996/g.55100 Transcript_36996/m.55100 type:complete len:80 (-) Transcript_36996:44-283(-)